MYKDNEELITTKGLGKEGSPNYIKKGSKVKFVKVANPDCSDLAQSLLIVESNEKAIAVRESDVRIKSLWRRIKAVIEVNQGMYENFPRLRRSHHNPIKRLFYLAYYFVADLIKGEKVDGIDKVDWK